MHNVFITSETQKNTIHSLTVKPTPDAKDATNPKLSSQV